MASSEDVCGRAMTRVLRASIALIAVTALCALAACGTSAHGGPTHPSSPAPSHSVSDNPKTGAPQGPQPIALNPNSVKPATQQLFTPYDQNGTLTVAASKAVAGRCFATSIAVPVSGVFRCLAGNTILDPCFAPVHESSPAVVTCFVDPWSDGQRVQLSGKLPTYDPVLTSGDPWGLELANGVRCVSVTGAVPALGKVDLTYRCDGSTAAGITSGDNGTIIAHYGPTAGPLTDVAVATAWRGRSFRIG